MTQKRRGRPKADNPVTFRNVAVPLDVHHMIKELADMEERTIARQLAVMIRREHEQKLQS